MRKWLQFVFLLLIFLAACRSTESAFDLAGTAVPTTDIANLLQNRPAPGETVEIDAYFSGVNALVFPSPPPLEDQVTCPTFLWSAALTDQPFIPVLQFLNGMGSNTLPEDAAWLIAASPEAVANPGQDITPELPYHARLRGRLDDPAFAHCPNADRIFVVTETAAVYEEQPDKRPSYQLERPTDLSEWSLYHDAALGFSLAYPPDWTVESLAASDVLGGVLLRPFHHPNYPVIIRIHEGETHLDQYNPAAESSLLQGAAMGVFEQGWSLGQWPDSQHLPGYVVDHEMEPGQAAKSVLFSGNGRTYEFAFTYPTGFAASQELLTHFTALVESFRLDVLPGPLPMPQPPDLPTPVPTATPFPEMMGERGSNSEYWFMWSTPVRWAELTEQWPPPSDKTVLWRVWSDQAEAAALLADKTVSFPDGVMAFTLQIETGAEPTGTETTAIFGQTHWVNEQQGTAAAPFDLRLQAAAWREPYLYTFSLNCLSPTGADSSTKEAFNAYCRYVWDFYVYWFSLCAAPKPAATGPVAWQTIANDNYQYAFELPADWYDASHPSGAFTTFFSHPVHQQPPSGCPIPEGMMKMEFSADNFPGTEALAAYTAVSPIAGRHAWIKSWGDGEGGTFASDTKELIILGPEHSYRLFLYCLPQWTDECEQVFTHIVESFTIIR